MKVGLTMLPTMPMALSEMMLARFEALEPDSIWTVDHYSGAIHPSFAQELGMGNIDPDSFADPFTFLAALGQKTSIPLGVAVTDTMRNGAANLARTALSLQQFCPGGFNLGIGSGVRQMTEPFGYEFERPVARCEEVLSQLRPLLDTGEFPGTNGRLGIPLETQAGKPKVWLAGHGPRMLRLTGQYADGWIPALMGPMGPPEYRDRRAKIADHAKAAGRPMPECGLVAIVVFGESMKDIEQRFEAQPLSKLFGFGGTGEQFARYGLEHPLGPDSKGFLDYFPHDLDPDMLRELAPRIPFALIEEMMFAGNVDELVARFAQYADAGLEHILISDATVMAGGLEAAAKHAADLGELRERLRAL